MNPEGAAILSEQNYWARTAGRRLSRRGMLRGSAVAGLGLAGAALIGCGGDDEEAAPAAAATSAPAATKAAAVSTAAPPKAVEAAETSGGTFVNSYVPSFTYQHADPAPAIWSAGFTGPTHSQLVVQNTRSEVNAEWEVLPEAVTSWEEPDDTTYVFHLHEGLYFHNIQPAFGRQATSEDVKFSLDRISTKEPQFFRQHEFADMTVETPDDYTMVLKFPQPQAPFWNRICTYGTCILPTEMQETEGVLLTHTDPFSGTGPFIHDKYEVGEEFLNKKNPDYFKPGLPYLDAIQGLTMANRDTAWVQFQAGNLDFVDLRSRDYIEAAYEVEGATLQSRVQTATQWVVFHTEHPPYGDQRVRYAISLATPRQEFVDVGHRGEDFGVMVGPGGLNPWVHGEVATYSYDELKTRPGYRQSAADIEEDRAEARKLLDAAGATGLTENFGYCNQVSAWPYANTVGVLMQDAYSDVGLNYTLDGYSYSDVLVQLSSQDFNAFWTPQYANGVDFNEYLEFYFSVAGARNYGQWRSQEFNDLMAAQNLMTDSEERAQTVRKVVELLEKECPRAPTNIIRTNSVWWDYLHNYYIAMSGSVPPFDQIWKEA